MPGEGKGAPIPCLAASRSRRRFRDGGHGRASQRGRGVPRRAGRLHRRVFAARANSGPSGRSSSSRRNFPPSPPRRRRSAMPCFWSLRQSSVSRTGSPKPWRPTARLSRKRPAQRWPLTPGPGSAAATSTEPDHGAADDALQQAVQVAGPNPSCEQRYDLADYLAHLQVARGELEAGLASALAAGRDAVTEEERFYAASDTADAFLQFATSCDYHKLVDARSSDLDDDGWGACRRAVAAADEYYARAAEIASRAGRDNLRRPSDQSRSDLGARR